MGQLSPMQLSVEVKGSGYPVLCLHGHPGSGQSMSVFTNPLSQQFQTLAPDLRGYGKSQVTQEFEMADHLLDLEALLNQYNLKRCLVLGWSLGGILALELAVRHPERISGLILVATAARPRGNHPPVSWQDNAYTGIASVLNRISPGWLWNIETFGQRSLYRYLIQQHTQQAYQYLASEGWSAYLQTSAIANRALNKALRTGYNRLSELENIQCPSLVLIGAEDRHITPQASLETAQHLPNCKHHCYPNVAHLFPWEIPEKMLADVYQWLHQHPDVASTLAG